MRLESNCQTSSLIAKLGSQSFRNGECDSASTSIFKLNVDFRPFAIGYGTRARILVNVLERSSIANGVQETFVI